MKEGSKHQASKHEDQMKIGAWIDFRLWSITKLQKMWYFRSSFSNPIFILKHTQSRASFPTHPSPQKTLAQGTHRLVKGLMDSAHITLQMAIPLLSCEGIVCVKQRAPAKLPKWKWKITGFQPEIIEISTPPTSKMPPNVGAFWRDDASLKYEFAVLKLRDAPTKTFLKILPFSTSSNSYFFQFSICQSGTTLGWGSFLNFEMKAKVRDLQRCGVGAMETTIFLLRLHT